jgi:hypothetical protein
VVSSCEADSAAARDTGLRSAKTATQNNDLLRVLSANRLCLKE